MAFTDREYVDVATDTMSAFGFIQDFRITPEILISYASRGLIEDAVPDEYAVDGVVIRPQGRLRRLTLESVLRFIESCVKTEYDGEELLSFNDISQILGIYGRELNYYITSLGLKPDLVLPETPDYSDTRRFKRATVDDFIERYNNIRRKSTDGTSTD